jgi:pyruvate,water dikinase
MSFIKPFAELRKTDAAIAGGKGASLGEMISVGIPVPPGFVVTAQAFDRFLLETGLAAEVHSELQKVNHDDVASVERASEVLHALITGRDMPVDIADEIMAAHEKLGAEFVAVRSSATAEDSSAASWAGELESYLNTNRDQVIANVKRCWASLFTPRAIVYRTEKNMKDVHVSVAVVIQKMVQSEVAGITFTVHPVTRDTNQMIIEACWGLGELIVGGMVTPDGYVIDKRDGTHLDISVSEQEEMLVRDTSGNKRVSVPAQVRAAQKLSADQISEIGRICKSIETHYGFPCDIEWGMEAGTFYIVQSRPITTL